MAHFDTYCLPRRVHALFSLMDSPATLAFDMLLDAGTRCAAAGVCDGHEACERCHDEIRTATQDRH